jgi:hypothetical protein
MLMRTFTCALLKHLSEVVYVHAGNLRQLAKR